MKLRNFVIAAAAAAACSATWAEDYNVINIDLSDNTAFFGVTHFGIGNFTDTFKFTNGPASAAVTTGSLVTISLGGVGIQDINFTSADLNSVPFQLTSLAGGVAEYGFTMTGPLNAPFTITVVGSAAGVGPGIGGSYSGTLNVTPIPEPETYALMLAGLGAIGFLARRRKA